MSELNEQLLISLVKQRPYLFNTKEKNYRDAKLKENAWAKIVADLSQPAGSTPLAHIGRVGASDRQRNRWLQGAAGSPS